MCNRFRLVRQVGLSDLTSPEEVNAIILAEEGAVVAFISRVYEVPLVEFAGRGLKPIERPCFVLLPPLEGCVVSSQF